MRERNIPPDSEWLVANIHPLHRFCDAQGHILEFAAHQGEPDMFEPIARTIENQQQVLIECGPEFPADNSIYVVVDLPSPGIASGEGNTKPFSEGLAEINATGNPAAQGQAARNNRLLPDPMLLTHVRLWITQQAPSEIGTQMEWLWLIEREINQSAVHEYALQAAETLATCYGEWRILEDSPVLPQDWGQVLSDLHLQRDHYRVLARGEQLSSAEVRCDLAVDLSGRYLCMTVTLANGDWLQRYMRLGLNPDGHYTFPNAIYPNSAPEVAALHYEPFVSFAIPIPDPPAIPEVSAP